MKGIVLVLLGLLALAVVAVAAVVSTPDTSAQSTAEPPQVLQEFEPSEKLPADSAISFPVDI